MSDHPLKIYRATHRLTQQKLAEKLGVHAFTVSRWETGSRQVDRHLVAKVAEKTGIPPRELRPDLAEIVGAA